MRSLVLRPAGAMNATTAEPHLLSWMQEVGRCTPSTVIVDLTDVSLLDADGLQALVRLHDAVREYGGVFRVEGASERQQRIFDVTGWSITFETTYRSGRSRAVRQGIRARTLIRAGIRRPAVVTQ